MTETTTSQLPGCKQCGKPLTRKSRGPKPTYCSASCRAKAGAERAKADGRYKQWAANAKAKRQSEREANAKPCPYCGDLMAHPRRVQCGKPECKRKFNAERGYRYQLAYKARTGQWLRQRYTYERTCEVCGKTWQAKSKHARYCSTACTNKLARYERTCEGCGNQWLAKSPMARWCSTSCVTLWRVKVEEEHRRTWCLIPERHPSRQHIPKPRLFVQGNCIWCGEPFCVEDYTGTASYCSPRCQRADAKDRYRARKYNAYVEPVRRTQIFERDRWICHLCGKPTKRDAAVPDPLAPVLDHIIPLARGGTHEPANVACAHFLCNSAKGDRGGGEQLLLTGL